MDQRRPEGFQAHRQSDCASRRIRIWSLLPRWATRMDRIPSAEFFARATAAKTGRKFYIWTIVPAGSTLRFDPHNPHVLFAAMWEGYRTPWMLNSGGKTDGLYRSNDDGSTWKRVEGHGMPRRPAGTHRGGCFRRRFQRGLRADRSKQRRLVSQRRWRRKLVAD